MARTEYRAPLRPGTTAQRAVNAPNPNSTSGIARAGRSRKELARRRAFSRAARGVDNPNTSVGAKSRARQLSRYFTLLQNAKNKAAAAPVEELPMGDGDAGGYSGGGGGGGYGGGGYGGGGGGGGGGGVPDTTAQKNALNELYANMTNAVNSQSFNAAIGAHTNAQAAQEAMKKAQADAAAQSTLVQQQLAAAAAARQTQAGADLTGLQQDTIAGSSPGLTAQAQLASTQATGEAGRIEALRARMADVLSQDSAARMNQSEMIRQGSVEQLRQGQTSRLGAIETERLAKLAELQAAAEASAGGGGGGGGSSGGGGGGGGRRRSGGGGGGGSSSGGSMPPSWAVESAFGKNVVNYEGMNARARTALDKAGLNPGKALSLMQGSKTMWSKRQPGKNASAKEKAAWRARMRRIETGMGQVRAQYQAMPRTKQQYSQSTYFGR